MSPGCAFSRLLRSSRDIARIPLQTGAGDFILNKKNAARAVVYGSLIVGGAVYFLSQGDMLLSLLFNSARFMSVPRQALIPHPDYCNDLKERVKKTSDQAREKWAPDLVGLVSLSDTDLSARQNDLGMVGDAFKVFRNPSSEADTLIARRCVFSLVPLLPKSSMGDITRSLLKTLETHRNDFAGQMAAETLIAICATHQESAQILFDKLRQTQSAAPDNILPQIMNHCGPQTIQVVYQHLISLKIPDSEILPKLEVQNNQLINWPEQTRDLEKFFQHSYANVPTTGVSFEHKESQLQWPLLWIFTHAQDSGELLKLSSLPTIKESVGKWLFFLSFSNGMVMGQTQVDALSGRFKAAATSVKDLAKADFAQDLEKIIQILKSNFQNWNAARNSSTHFKELNKSVQEFLDGLLKVIGPNSAMFKDLATFMASSRLSEDFEPYLLQLLEQPKLRAFAADLWVSRYEITDTRVDHFEKLLKDPELREAVVRSLRANGAGQKRLSEKVLWKLLENFPNFSVTAQRLTIEFFTRDPDRSILILRNGKTQSPEVQLGRKYIGYFLEKNLDSIDQVLTALDRSPECTPLFQAIMSNAELIAGSEHPPSMESIARFVGCPAIEDRLRSLSLWLNKHPSLRKGLEKLALEEKDPKLRAQLQRVMNPKTAYEPVIPGDGRMEDIRPDE